LTGRLFTKKWTFLIFLGPHSQLPAPIDVKFCTDKRTQMPVGPAKLDRNRCNESPLRGENPDFWPVSKNNTGSLPLGGILPVTKASSHEGQCIPAGSSVSPLRLVLLSMSIITMRTRLFPAISASVCLRFAKSRPQFCESCGATYKRICEMFSALQSTSGPVTDDVNSVQIDA